MSLSEIAAVLADRLRLTAVVFERDGQIVGGWEEEGTPARPPRQLELEGVI